ncbi:MAG TPA: MucR family transcriptional regulator [Syntrophobacteraceae bacterium]|jgi:predicted transcriptional regulator|nr:MucR family transcriptional regulator [Syntrophobacteraceae bacterium]HBD07193.1 MucR family transcriptional regulator [Syntrophobacteraceae bacterium]HBZ55371.1 MucR family transcriptional regulator [Syntrophobacteraceae bacterium]
MNKKLLEIAADLVQAQAANARMSGEELEAALMRTYNTLLKMQQAEQEGKSIDSGVAPVEKAEESAPQLPEPAKSIQRNKVVCLECGAEFKQLTANHLRSHQLTPREYKRKWGFPLKQPLTAKNLTASRSKSAKERGLPVKLKEYIEKRSREKASQASKTPAVAAAPSRRPRKKPAAE